MILGLIGSIVLLVVVVPVVVVLLRGVLDAARRVSAAVEEVERAGEGGVGGPRRGRVAGDDPDPGQPDDRRGRELRRLARRHPRGRLMDAAALITIIAVVLIVLALVFYLVSVIARAAQDHRRARRRHRRGRRDPAPRPSRSRASSRRSTPTSRPAARCSRACWRRRPGPRTARDWSSRCSRAAARRCCERQGREGPVKNIDVVYTRGAVQLARLGRESPLGTGGDPGAALRDPLYSSAAARSLYFNPARPGDRRAGAAALAGDRQRRPGRLRGPRRRGQQRPRRQTARPATGPTPTTTRPPRRRPDRARRTSPT